MKKQLAFALTALLVGSAASAKITVKIPKAFKGRQFTVASQPVNDLLRGAPLINGDTLKIKKTKWNIKTNVSTPTAYFFSVDGNIGAPLFLLPGEDAVYTVTSIVPFEAVASGTQLNDGVAQFDALTTPFQERMDKVRSGFSVEDADEIYKEYTLAVENFINNNFGTDAGAFALMQLDEEPFMVNYEKMKESADKSPFGEYLSNKYTSAKRRAEAAKKQKDMEENHVAAPDFTLNNLSGEPFTLSSLRGKWVVIDFWGSWCGWCIKGFPALKEAYQKYDGILEVVGVDCGDTPEAWKAAVAKFKLPWINVYNPQSETSVDKVYGIQGFPTKIIVDPQGNIARIVTGEDPQFYTILDNLINPVE